MYPINDEILYLGGILAYEYDLADVPRLFPHLYMNITVSKYLEYLLSIDYKLFFVYTLGEDNVILTHPFRMC